jgi:hypothetical protein
MNGPKVNRRREKVLMFLKYGLDSFKKSCNRFINFGLMDRLFGNFDFFNVFDRDSLSAQSKRFMREKKKF